MNEKEFIKQFISESMHQNIEKIDLFSGEFLLFAIKEYSKQQLKDFAKEMQNISVMDDDLNSDEYVDMWLSSLEELPD